MYFTIFHLRREGIFCTRFVTWGSFSPPIGLADEQVCAQETQKGVLGFGSVFLEKIPRHSVVPRSVCGFPVFVPVFSERWGHVVAKRQNPASIHPSPIIPHVPKFLFKQRLGLGAGEFLFHKIPFCPYGGRCWVEFLKINIHSMHLDASHSFTAAFLKVSFLL